MANDLMQELEQITLAVHMLGLNARLRTVRLATRLSSEKARRINARFRQQHSVALSHHRGRVPTQPLQYMRAGAMQLETSIWAALLLKHGLVRGRRPRPWLEQHIEYGRRFCEAYAEYLQLSRSDTLNFEQAWHFARVLAERDVVRLQRCTACNSVFVRGAARQRRECPLCRLRTQLLRE